MDVIGTIATAVALAVQWRTMQSTLQQVLGISPGLSSCRWQGVNPRLASPMVPPDLASPMMSVGGCLHMMLDHIFF
eukprot:2657442-Amphidinium_carterae.1